MRITVKKITRGRYGIYKNNKKIDEETTKDKALGAASFYRAYYKVSPKKRSEWVRKAR